MGDNRNHSEDSRFSDVGCVKKEAVLGKVLFVVFPGRQTNEFGTVTGGRSWHRFGRYHEAGRHQPEHHEYPVVPRPHDQDAPDDRGGCEARRRRVRNSRRAHPDSPAATRISTRFCGNKPRMIVLNRIDMADPALTKKMGGALPGEGLCRSADRLQDEKGHFRLCSGGAHAAG